MPRVTYNLTGEMPAPANGVEFTTEEILVQENLDLREIIRRYQDGEE